MKRGTPEHPKAKKLARILHVNRAWAIGILESLWHWAGKFAQQGDIGKFSDEDIAEAVFWPKEPCVLVDALVSSGWVDADPVHRLLIHDWHDHAEEAVKKYLNRHGLAFLTGCRDGVETVSRQVETSRDKNRLPLPSPQPSPQPSPEPLPPPFHGKHVSDSFDSWFSYLAKRGKAPIDRDLAVAQALQFFSTPEEVVQSVAYAIANGWTTLKNWAVEFSIRQHSPQGDTTAAEGLKRFLEGGDSS